MPRWSRLGFRKETQNYARLVFSDAYDLISLKLTACRICVFLSGLLGVKICLSHAQIGLFKGSQKAWATPRWSPLGVKFKISDGGVPPPRSYKFKKCAFSQIKVETFVEMVRANLQNLARKHLEITSAILVTAQGRLIICTEETSI